jgi:hypothetical protein
LRRKKRDKRAAVAPGAYYSIAIGLPMAIFVVRIPEFWRKTDTIRTSPAGKIREIILAGGGWTGTTGKSGGSWPEALPLDRVQGFGGTALWLDMATALVRRPRTGVFAGPNLRQ